MTKHIIRQLWEQYLQNGSKNRLAEIIERLDFSDDFSENADIRDGVAGAMREQAGKKDIDSLHARNRDIAIVHKFHIADGMSATESYSKIASTLKITPDAVRKVLERNGTN